MHAIATPRAARRAAVAIDVRGHGRLGARGDIGYRVQLDDDVAGLIVELPKAYPAARPAADLRCASAGARLATSSSASSCSRPTSAFPLRPTGRRKAGPMGVADMPRSVATLALDKLGIDWSQALSAIAFEKAPGAKMKVTSQYSFRPIMNYTAPPDGKGAFPGSKGRIAVRAGLMALPGVDHMGVVHRSEAIKAILAAMADSNA
jgi:hypothetical protein